MRLLSILALTACVLHAHAQDVTRYVNPFIGTANGGNTFPGAVRPWGMVSVSPHNAPGAPSGYVFGAKYFLGFGHVHLSGTGCADLGSVILTASRGAVHTDPDGYRCEFTDEQASPGYYRTSLIGPAVIAEVTSTLRCGITRFSSQREGELNIIIDAGRCLSLQAGGSLSIVSPTEAEGYNIAGGICGESNRERVYFFARFSTPPDSSGIRVGGTPAGSRSRTVNDTALACWFRFKCAQGDRITVKVGISYVSSENARANIDAEAPHWDFDRYRFEALEAWQKELARVRIEGGSRDDLAKFYTALYHSLIHPNLLNDVNGDYPLSGQAGVGRHAGRDRYTVFSLWDTYRTLHPLLTLVYPERQSAMVHTMLDIYRESGWLPKWEIAANETHLMVGDGAVPVIADSYLKGITDFNIDTALAAMEKPAALAGRREALPMRPGYHEYLQYHYIPFEQDTNQEWWVWGPVSTTLEYCLADWTISRVAQALHRNTDHVTFEQRSLYYRTLFDSTSQFIRPKLKSGAWLVPFDPLGTEGSGSWAGSGGPGYVEGNAWQYTWFVPHDVNGLIGLFGGPEAFVAKLERCFSNGQFTINNEPDIAYPYLFSYIPGEEYRTRMHVREIMDRQFGTGPEGLPGNDDTGTISAWFVFSALGFYPACPASGEYRLGIPLFEKAAITLNPQYYSGKSFTVEARGPVRQALHSLQINLNGHALHESRIAHADVVSGGTLTFSAPR